MPVFRFRGFETGTAVSLSASQGSNSDSASVATWGQAASTPITVSVSALRTEGTAPMGTIFHADAASPAARVDSPYHDIENVWSFDDPGTFSALGNGPIWGTDKNVAYGPRATHVFASAKPGSDDYIVTNVAHDGENPANSATIDIKVNDPNTVFAGADTAVVSQSGDFAGAPSGASQFSSISAAENHLSGRTTQRLLLRAGETFNENVRLTASGSVSRLCIGAFGSGSKPVINVQGTGTNDAGVSFSTSQSNAEECIVFGLRIVGPYDPTSASPLDYDPNGISFKSVGRNVHKTVWDCEIEGVNQGVNLEGTNSFTDPQRNFYMGNTRIIGWRDYGVFSGDGGDWGLSGCTVQQPTGTRNANGKGSSPYWADHGPFRISRAYGTVIISNNDWTSFNDWSGNDSSRNMQPIIRWNTGNGQENGGIAEPELVIDRFRGEGAMLRLYNNVDNDTGGGPPSTTNPAWVVVDRVHHITTAHPQNAFEAPLGGTTIRNAIFVSPNCAPGWGTGMRRFFSDTGGGASGAGNLSRRSEVYSCALIDQRSDANARSRNGITTNRDFDAGGFTENVNPDTFMGNNIEYAPNMADGAPADPGPLDESTNWSPLYDGERWKTNPVDTTRDYGDEVSASFRPLSGSSAIGGASGKVSLLDFDGALRSEVLAGLSRSIPSVGPYEPDLES